MKRKLKSNKDIEEQHTSNEGNIQLSEKATESTKIKQNTRQHKIIEGN
jgi:hypothetical protein